MFITFTSFILTFNFELENEFAFGWNLVLVNKCFRFLACLLDFRNVVPANAYRNLALDCRISLLFRLKWNTLSFWELKMDKKVIGCEWGGVEVFLRCQWQQNMLSPYPSQLVSQDNPSSTETLLTLLFFYHIKVYVPTPWLNCTVRDTSLFGDLFFKNDSSLRVINAVNNKIFHVKNIAVI